MAHENATTNDAKRDALFAAISGSIVIKLGEGLSVPEAIDAVLGAGTYERMTGEVYDALRAKAAAV